MKQLQYPGQVKHWLCWFREEGNSDIPEPKTQFGHPWKTSTSAITVLKACSGICCWEHWMLEDWSVQAIFSGSGISWFLSSWNLITCPGYSHLLSYLTSLRLIICPLVSDEYSFMNELSQDFLVRLYIKMQKQSLQVTVLQCTLRGGYESVMQSWSMWRRHDKGWYFLLE